MRITFSIPMELVKEARMYATEHDTSLNQIIRDYLVCLATCRKRAEKEAEEFVP